MASRSTARKPVSRASERGWTAPRRKLLTEYVGDLADCLHLADWHITVNFDVPADEDAYAEIVPHSNQRRAEIRVGSSFDILDAAGVRQTLVHELLHCHLFAPHHLAEELLVASAGKKSSLALIALNAAVEQATDAIAEAMAAMVPLPPLGVLPKRAKEQAPPARVLVARPSRSTSRRPR